MTEGHDRITRRRVLTAGAGGVVIAAAGVVELVKSGALPGKGLLDRLDGACSVPAPPETYHASGPTVTGSFFSHARNRTVRYTLAYPPGHDPGSRLPLVLFLYGDGGNQTSTLGGIAPARALAGHVRSGALAPMAIGVADGGRSLYWNAHPGDDPMRMLTDEFIPLCKQHGLGVSPHSIGVLGISMGGYGALLLTETHPNLISAAAVISPAIWTSYEQARAVNAEAFTDAATFTDVITHASQLTDVPVRIASGSDDPFHPGVLALARHLPATVHLELNAGCHDDSYFAEQQLPSLQFLGRYLAGA
jgi:pimeloyl-ACP methyl ester carboxylesterase